MKMVFSFKHSEINTVLKLPDNDYDYSYDLKEYPTVKYSDTWLKKRKTPNNIKQPTIEEPVVEGSDVK